MFGSGAYGTTLYGDIAGGDGSIILADTITLSESLIGDKITVMVQSLGLSDSSIATLYAISLSESLQIADVSTAIGKYIATLQDGVELSNILTPTIGANVTESLVLADSIVLTVLKLITLIDELALADSLKGNETARLVEVMLFKDIATIILQAIVTESLVLTNTIDPRFRGYAQLVETLALQDAATGLAIVTVILEDTVDLEDSATALGSYIATLADGVGFSVSLVIDGVPYLGLVMNSASRGVTEYTNYNFNSIANFDGKLYGVNDVGLFLLEGDTDDGDPIAAFARTSLMRIANGQQSRVDCAYVGYRSDGTMQMKVITSGAAGQKLSYIYDMVEVVAESTRPNRIKFGRGLKAAYYAFEISNTNGSDFALDILEIHPIPLERRVP